MTELAKPALTEGKVNGGKTSKFQHFLVGDIFLPGNLKYAATRWLSSDFTSTDCKTVFLTTNPKQYYPCSLTDLPNQMNL